MNIYYGDRLILFQRTHIMTTVNLPPLRVIYKDGWTGNQLMTDRSRGLMDDILIFDICQQARYHQILRMFRDDDFDLGRRWSYLGATVHDGF